MVAQSRNAVVPLLTLALLCSRSALAQVPASPETIEAQELFWSYNRSPPVYPSPEANGTGDWAAAYEYATQLVAQMTNEEKQNLTFGFTTTSNGCSGTSGSALRVGFPGLCLNDGPAGIRGTELVSGFASGIHVAASWNRDLAKARGQAIGLESKAKGVNVWLGPVMGPLGRTVLGGRNWEGFSVDPYLCGVLNADTVIGVQENTIVSAKHYIGNEQETNRNPTTSTGNASVSSNIDDRTLHELYLWPFQDVVKAGAGSVMCSYNKINGSYGCQNSKTQNGLLKGELGFQGFIVSDWGAQHAGIASADAGLDMAMPNSDYWDGNLTIAVDNGTFAQSRLDDMAKRIVATWYKLAHFEPGTGVPYDLLSPHDDQKVSALTPTAKDTIHQGALEGHVLVKNVNNALPLKSPTILSLYGYDGPAPAAVNPGAGFSKWTLGFNSINISDADVLTFFSGNLTDSDLPQAAYGGTLISGGGSGAVTPPYISAPFDAFAQRARDDGTQIFWDFASQDPAHEAGSDACLVFINAFATEGFDRTALTDPWSDALVANVAAKCANTVVVVHNAGIRLVDAWIEHPNVTAVVLAHLPGQDSGRALVELVYGDASPSGKLPYTLARSEADYGSVLQPVRPDATSDYYTQANFTEGLYIDYRAFEAQNIAPRFPFGYGLTYTEFEYSDLAAELAVASPPEAAPPGAVVEGGLESLWETVATVTATVTNTGNYSAAEIVQLYVGIPYEGTPVKQLRGFAKVPLEVGASAQVEFPLTRRDLSVWDVVSQGWILPRGTHQVYVAASVEDVRLTGSLVVE